jgi:urea ABC transporter ATP-binding protein UrtE
MLRASAVHAGYGSVPVLVDVTLELREREILVLLGRNGVGKTTLMRVLVGLLVPRLGRVELDGADLTGAPPHAIARRGVAYVPQGRGIFPKLTVRENLKVGTRANPDRSAGIPDLVFTCFPVLKERLGQLGGTLSGGEQQMLAIARALCGRPRVLLLDEPSEGVQPSIVHQLGALIEAIVARGDLSVLLVEQNLDLALSVATRCAVMEKGSVVREGSPEVFRDEAVLREYLAI